MSPDSLRDFSAGEGLRRAVLVRNAMIANIRREQQLLQQEQQQQHQQAAMLAAANQRIQHTSHTRTASDDDSFVSLSYPWQLAAAARQAQQQQQPYSPAFSSYQSQYIVYDTSSSSSSSSSPSASPSSSTSSLEASILEEQEQAYFDDLLSELEGGDLIHSSAVPPAATQLDYGDDDDELLASLTSSHQDCDDDGDAQHQQHSSSSSLRSTSNSLELSSTSFGDLPELIQDGEDSGSDDDEDEDDDLGQQDDDGATVSAVDFITLPARVALAPSIAKQQHRQVAPPSSPSPILGAPRLLLQLQLQQNKHQDPELAASPHSDIQKHQQRGMPDDNTAIGLPRLALLPPVFALPASAYAW
ncbi:hypothetical protein V8E36_000883 [Tilletia maclaganii]